jgi:hypothetical protein
MVRVGGTSKKIIILESSLLSRLLMCSEPFGTISLAFGLCFSLRCAFMLILTGSSLIESYCIHPSKYLHFKTIIHSIYTLCVITLLLQGYSGGLNSNAQAWMVTKSPDVCSTAASGPLIYCNHTCCGVPQHSRSSTVSHAIRHKRHG